MDTNIADGSCLFRPDGEMTIYTAADLKTQLVAALETCRSLEVDLSGVAEMDTAGLQLLILAKRESQKRRIGLHISGHSAAVLDVFDQCNMQAFFGDPVVIPFGTH